MTASIENTGSYLNSATSEQKYRIFFEDSPDTIFISTQAGQIIDINPAGLELFGYTKTESMQMNAQDFYVDLNDRLRFQQEIEQHGRVRGFEVRLRTKDGAEIDCLITATVRQADDGTVLNYQGIIRDITLRKQAAAVERERLLQSEREQRRLAETLRKQLLQLTQQVVSAQEEERKRLSRELHDELGQALIALKLNLELIQSDLPAESDSLYRRLAEAINLTHTTLQQMRLLAQNLRPPELDAMGLNATLTGFCHTFAAHTQIPIDYHGLELPFLPEAINICLYRFLQAALTNVAKHAGANQVRVALHYNTQTVSLSVEDNGRGFDRQAALWSADVGLGLLGMQERIELLSGWLELETRPGQGTCLTAHIPWKENK